MTAPQISNPAADHWSDVAAAWDRSIDAIDAGSKAATVQAFVDTAGIRPGDAVLELAAGPGSLGAIWSALVGPHGSVTLSDVAPGMVDVARRRTAHLGNVDVAVIDMAVIDRPDASFDVVVSRMGLMFVVEPARAVGEMRRVLRPGGRFAAMTWAGVEHNPWMSCVGMAAMMNGLVAGGPPVGPGGIFSLGDPDLLRRLVCDAGFDDVEVAAIDTTFEAANIDEHIARVSSLAGPLAAAFDAATPEQLAAVRQTAAGLAAPYTSDAGVCLPGRALLVSARR